MYWILYFFFLFNCYILVCHDASCTHLHFWHLVLKFLNHFPESFYNLNWFLLHSKTFNKQYSYNLNQFLLHSKTFDKQVIFCDILVQILHMAHLHCRTRIRIPTWDSVSKPNGYIVLCRTFHNRTGILASYLCVGQESESKSVSETVSSNANEPVHVDSYVKLVTSEIRIFWHVFIDGWPKHRRLNVINCTLSFFLDRIEESSSTK